MSLRNLLRFIFIVYGTCVFAHGDSTRVVVPHVSPAMRFTENLGQWQENILFRAALNGGAMYIEKNALTFDFYDKKKFRALHHGGIYKGKYNDLEIKSHAYKVSFEGCNPSSPLEKMQEGSDYENFFIGNDPGKWKGNVRNYHQVWLRNLYNNIDYEIVTAVNGVKYNFHVKPGGDPGEVKLRYEGADNLKLKKGALFVELSVNGVMEQKPYAYQLIDGKVMKVECNYTLKRDILGFEFPRGYNKNYDLVIDPILVFAAQSGSSADNFGMTATFDASGNLYAGGTVFNNGYPTTLGAYSTTFNGTNNTITDVVITKYNSSGNQLLYSTYIGGIQAEVVSSLIVDYSNNLCFYGTTSSTNFPTTAGAYDNSFNGGQALSFYTNGTNFVNGTDIYVAKFNSSGTTLMASTFIGGSGNDGVNHVNHLSVVPISSVVSVLEYTVDSLQYNYGDQYRGEIQVDKFNNIYIASSTRSSDFPTANAFDNTLGGKQDAIVAKFNSSLTQLLFSTYLGGSSNECGNALIVNDNSEVFVTGGTCSNNFPVTTGAHSTVYNGGKADGFIAHFNSAGNQVLHATYIGTNSYDQSYFIQSDKYENVFVYGQSLGNMPIIPSIPPLPYHNPGRHQFITRYNKNLNVMSLSTVFGNYLNNVDISPCAFAVDKCNNIYLSGWGGNLINNSNPLSNMPLLQPTQSTTDGNDFYFMGLDSNFISLKYGSYFGGNISDEHVDGGTSRFDPRGRIYQSACAGCGGFDDFPVTAGAWPNSPGNPNKSTNCNNGVVKLDFQLQLTIATINTATFGVCSNVPVTFTNATPPGNPGATVRWYFNNVLTSTNVNTPSYTFTNAGIYTVALVVNDNLTCNKKDSTVTFVTVYPKPGAVIAAINTQCTNTVAFTNTVSGSLSSSPYVWNFGDGTQQSTLTAPIHVYANNGTYTVTFTATDVNGCKDIVTKTVSVFNFEPGVAGSATICYGKSASLNASGGTSYTWSPPVSLSNGFISNPVATPTLNTIYTVQINNNSPGYTCSRSLTAGIMVNPTPTTNFSYSLNPCGGGAYFSDKSKDDVVAWNWQFTSVAGSTVQNPYYFFPLGGTFTINLESTNTFGCKSSNDSVIVVSPPEPVSANGASIICRGDKAQLNASGGISYQWTPSLTLDYPGSASPLASPTISTHYSVFITTEKNVNGVNCEYALTTTVNVTVLSNTQIKAKAEPELIVTGSSSTLTYIGDPGASITWLPPGSTFPGSGYLVNAKPDRPTTYTVVAQRGPCTETITVHVDAFTEGCLQNDAFIPNTFTPNGDGQNDILKVRSVKVTGVYFAVYNRWGELVYETNDVNEGWNGIYKGKAAESGVYGWYLKAVCGNGEEAFMKGNVTLVR